MDRDYREKEALDQEIKTCFQAKPGADFAARITAAAFSETQISTNSVGQWFRYYIRETLRELHLPTPAVTFALLLFLGIGMGFGFSPLLESEVDMITITDTFYGERGLI